MKHIRAAHELAFRLLLCAWLYPAAASASSPLGLEPARIEYLTNDAPFVVFDIAPRSLDAEPTPSGQGHAALSFVATEALQQVSVAVAVRPHRAGRRERVTARTSCGPQIAGHHRCKLPTDVALTQLDGEGGSIVLRIHAQAEEGARSVVHISLPVRPTRAAAPSLSETAAGERRPGRAALRQ